jgi:hypothetical protein
MHKIIATSLLLAVALSTGCGETPQLGGDEASWTTADALWTAVTAKNPSLVQDCAVQIRNLQAKGKLAPETAAALEALTKEALDGSWDEARNDLKAFVQGQRSRG